MSSITQVVDNYVKQELPLKDYFIIAGVVIGLITFFYQVYINKKQFKMQTFFNYTNRYQDIIMHLPIDIEANDFKYSTLEDQDLRWFRAYFDLCSEEYYLSKKHLIDNDVWLLWKSGLEASIQKPAFKYAWGKIQKNSYYCKEYEKFIMSLIKNNQK